jgi:YHS domain-containing protein
MAQVTDPVCGMTVDTTTANLKSEYQGQSYYFCGPGCKKAFDKEPEKYMGQDKSAGDSHAGHSH